MDARKTGADLVLDIAQALSAEGSLDDLWPSVCPRLLELVGARGLAIRLCDETRAAQVAYCTPGFDDRAGADIATAPIAFAGATLGDICLTGNAPYDAQSLKLLETCALSIGSRLHHERTLASSQRYAQLALTDGLTGVPNRRMFDEVFAREWSHAARESAVLTAVMIDLDYFKAFNDSYGHQAGDLCLSQVAHAIRGCIRRSVDLFARYGGEEFVALLPGTDLEGGIALAEAFRSAVAALGIAHAGSSLGRVSISVGVASEIPGASSTPDSILRAADDGLYRAKLDGRNRVVATDYESDAPQAQRSAGSARNNVPLVSTRTIGRKTEVAAVHELLAEHRLVCIAGIGGSGKTRTALQVGGALLGHFQDGVWFADLSPLGDPSLVASTIAALFGAHVSVDDEAPVALAQHLHDKDALLLLDNCEHLIDEVARVVDALLKNCPSLRVLATSREPLGVGGEAVYRLPLLPIDDAIELFVERTQAIKRDFELTPENRSLVGDICRRLDGIALAIELAASRVGVTGLAPLAKHLDERLRVLTGGDRALPRQQTMRALIDWSHELLAPRERAVFRRLGVFAGGFTFDAATAVCAGGDVEREDLFDSLSSLIRKSMLADDLASSDSRYRLLDSMREYAADRMSSAGENAKLAQAHAHYFLDVAERHFRSRATTPTHRWIEGMLPDIDNLRAALEWSLESRNDIPLGAALVSASMTFFNEMMPGEAVRWIARALELLPRDADPAVEAHLNFGMATMTRNASARQLRTAGERAVELYRRIGDTAGLAEALRALAQNIGWFFREDRELADTLACESIELARLLRDPLQLANSLKTRGLTIDISDFPAKRAVLEEALALMRTCANDRQLGTTLTWISDLEFSAGDERRALVYGHEAVAVAERSGSTHLMTITAGNLSQYAAALGHWPTVRAMCERGLRLALVTREHEHITYAIQALATLAAAHEQSALAARLLGFCESRVGTMHPHRQADQCEDILYRRLLADLHTALGADELEREMNDGAALTESDAVALALAL